MGTAKLFWDDPYATSFDGARVVRVAGAEVELDRTILFAFSGGQERDEGTIAGRSVLDASWRDDGTISYTLQPDHGLSVGDEVSLEIDWARRYRLMRLHFAAELVLETTYRLPAPIEKIGAHIAVDKARLDFALDRPITRHLPEIAEAVNALIVEDRAITSAFSDPATERRYWEIEGFARVPCGGTHIKRTGEVGAVRLKRDNIGKGKERIVITVPDTGGASA